MPMGEYENFADCKKKVKAKHPDWSDKRVEKYCGKIYWKTHKNEDLIKEMKEFIDANA